MVARRLARLRSSWWHEGQHGGDRHGDQRGDRHRDRHLVGLVVVAWWPVSCGCCGSFLVVLAVGVHMDMGWWVLIWV